MNPATHKPAPSTNIHNAVITANKSLVFFFIFSYYKVTSASIAEQLFTFFVIQVTYFAYSDWDKIRFLANR